MESQKSNQQQRRERIEKILEDRVKRLQESEEKKRFLAGEKEKKEKEKKIQLLEEKVLKLEKDLNQIRLDFSRYRARNK